MKKLIALCTVLSLFGCANLAQNVDQARNEYGADNVFNTAIVPFEYITDSNAPSDPPYGKPDGQGLVPIGLFFATKDGIVIKSVAHDFQKEGPSQFISSSKIISFQKVNSDKVVSIGFEIQVKVESGVVVFHHPGAFGAYQLEAIEAGLKSLSIPEATGAAYIDRLRNYQPVFLIQQVARQ